MAMPTNLPPTALERSRASEALTRLINDYLLHGFEGMDGYGIEVEAREVHAFINQHWESIARYAHLIHGD